MTTPITFPKAYERIKYPDGGVYCKLTKLPPIEIKFEPVIKERINNYEDLFFLGSIVDAFKSKGIYDIHLTIPCMFQQQHDRRFQSNESFELKLVCNYINSLGFKSVEVFKPHSDAVLMGLNNSSELCNKLFISEALRKAVNLDSKNTIVLSPDAGSFKWIYKACECIDYNAEIYTASKVRDHESHKLINVIDRTDFNGKDIIILDDLSVYGGTFVNLAKMLKDRNVGKLYLVVHHLTVPNPNKELETLFETVYTSNSKFEQSEYQLNNLKTINLF